MTFEGMKPQPMRFSTSEGTTPFVFEGKTYFYVSDPGAAEWRSSTFKASEAWVPPKAAVNRKIGDLPHKTAPKANWFWFDWIPVCLPRYATSSFARGLSGPLLRIRTLRTNREKPKVEGRFGECAFPGR